MSDIEDYSSRYNIAKRRRRAFRHGFGTVVIFISIVVFWPIAGSMIAFNYFMGRDSLSRRFFPTRDPDAFEAACVIGIVLWIFVAIFGSIGYMISTTPPDAR